MCASNKHDFRLLLPAVCMWAVTAIMVKSPYSADLERFLILVVAAIVGLALVCAVLLLRVAGRARLRVWLMPYLCVCIAASMCALINSTVYVRMVANDAVNSTSVRAAQTVSAHVHITSPPIHSSLRGFSCSVQARLQAVRLRGVWQRSSVRVSLLARNSRDCSVQTSAQYFVHGTVGASNIGRTPWNLRVQENCSSCVRLLRPASALHAAVSHVQQRFLSQTSRLGGTASLLVPGVTLGVMGHDAFLSSVVSNGYEPNNHSQKKQADKLKDSFRTAGIMHVLAVSGGHFALAASTVTWLCTRLRINRRIRALLLIAANAGLYLVMYPSDSVLRASIMMFFSSLYVFLGRKTYASCALCWTIILCVLFNPEVAASIGFALSCAAVIGILTWSRWGEKLMTHLLPSWLAAPMALTVSAQLATLPLSYILSDEVPMYAIVSNLLVSVPMDIATVFGLISLALSWLWPQAGYVCAWLSGCATAVMVRVSDIIIRLPYASVSVPVSVMVTIYIAGSVVIGSSIWGWRWWQNRYRFEREYRVPFKQRMRERWQEFIRISVLTQHNNTHSCPRWKGH